MWAVSFTVKILCALGKGHSTTIGDGLDPRTNLNVVAKRNIFVFARLEPVFAVCTPLHASGAFL
jgi:hypothetical protein